MMLLGIAANRLHHQTEDAALFALLRACESGIRELHLGLHAVGRTYDAIAQPTCCTVTLVWCAIPMAVKVA